MRLLTSFAALLALCSAPLYAADVPNPEADSADGMPPRYVEPSQAGSPQGETGTPPAMDQKGMERVMDNNVEEPEGEDAPGPGSNAGMPPGFTLATTPNNRAPTPEDAMPPPAEQAPTTTTPAAPPGIPGTTPPVPGAPNPPGQLPEGATVSPSQPPVGAGDTNFDTVMLQGLNKVTARAESIEAPIGSVVRYGTIEIVAHKCWKSSPEDRPEDAALLEVSEIKQGEAPMRIFSGWMFASTPALASLEHPFYDINVISCANSGTKR